MKPRILAYSYVNVEEVIPASTLKLNFGTYYCLSFKYPEFYCYTFLRKADEEQFHTAISR